MVRIGKDRTTARRATLLPLAALVLFLAAFSPATAAACPDASHRFDSFSLFAPALGRAKRILVYLPSGYDCGEDRYPVLYVNDGHDLFDWNPYADGLEPELAEEIARREAWYGSWRLGSQLEEAAAERRLPAMIVVGIASDDGWRTGDLVPVAWSGAVEGRGVAYGRFVAETLVPAIDELYRTHGRRDCRGVGGSSLGGVAALQIGLAHGDVFGRALSVSPVLGDPAIEEHLAEAWALAARQTEPASILVDLDDDAIGTADRARLAETVAAAPAATRPEATVLQTPGGRHDIASWAERVIPDLELLLDGWCGG